MLHTTFMMNVVCNMCTKMNDSSHGHAVRRDKPAIIHGDQMYDWELPVPSSRWRPPWLSRLSAYWRFPRKPLALCFSLLVFVPSLLGLVRRLLRWSPVSPPADSCTLFPAFSRCPGRPCTSAQQRVIDPYGRSGTRIMGQKLFREIIYCSHMGTIYLAEQFLPH